MPCSIPVITGGYAENYRGWFSEVKLAFQVGYALESS